MLVAQDDQTNEQIAAAVGVRRQTVDLWKKRPEFQAAVEGHRRAWAEEIKRRGIAERQNRVDAYNDRWQRMQAVILARGEDPEFQDVPGGTTGLLARTFKTIGGRDPQIVEEFAVDTGLLREMREIEKQAAEDLGQWVIKQDQSGDAKLTIEYVNDWRQADRPAIPAPRPAEGAA